MLNEDEGFKQFEDKNENLKTGKVPIGDVEIERTKSSRGHYPCSFLNIGKLQFQLQWKANEDDENIYVKIASASSIWSFREFVSFREKGFRGVGGFRLKDNLNPFEEQVTYT